MSLVRDAFVLPRTTPREVFKKLLNGNYNQMTLADISFTLKDDFQRKVDHEIISFDNPSFEERVTSNGKKLKLAKINQEMYSQFISEGKINMREDYTCLWCRKKRNCKEHGYPVQVPFYIEKKMNKIFVHVIYTTCTFNCALAEIKCRLERFPNDQAYIEALALITFLFRKQYPGKTLRESPDYLLHEDNGGPLSDDIYYNGMYIFKEMNDIVMIPCQRMYFFSKSE